MKTDKPHEVRIKLDPLLDFEFWLSDPDRDLAYSAQTIKIYMRVTRVFYDYIIVEGLDGPENASTLFIDAYANSMHDHGLASTSIQTYLAALKTFYDYLVDRAVVPRNPVAGVLKKHLDNQSRIPDIERLLPSLDQQEQERLMAAIARRRHQNRQRDLALVGFLLDTGLRIDELATVTIEQAVSALTQGELSLSSHTGLVRTFKILDDYASLVRSYAMSRSGEGAQARLFSARTGAPISGALAHKLISQALRAAGIHKPQMGPSLLRYTAIHRMLRAGFSPVEVKQALGLSAPISLASFASHERADC